MICYKDTHINCVIIFNMITFFSGVQFAKRSWHKIWRRKSNVCQAGKQSLIFTIINL